MSDITYEELIRGPTTFFIIISSFLSSFLSDITYEELIQNVLRYISICLSIMSDITYEELIRITITCTCFCRSNICRESDITYEELIPDKSNICREKAFPKSRTLPMRNWYAARSAAMMHTAIVGHYLWGIDTNRLATIRFEIIHEDSRTLPMRNWYDVETSEARVTSSGSTVGHYLWGIDTFNFCHFSVTD